MKPQATEDSVGPYALQDFTLFHVLRRGYRPSKIAFLAWHAWHDASRGSGRRASRTSGARRTTSPTIRHWLEVFCKRFFASQFKRSALPNGPKVSAGGTMSPARRLADAVRRQRRRLAGRAGERAPAIGVWLASASRKSRVSSCNSATQSGGPRFRH